MKTSPFFFLTLFLTGICVSSYAETSEPFDFCYKPQKLLFFATEYYKNRYNEDIKEYERCQKVYIETQERVAEMQKESEKNSLSIWNKFVRHHQKVQ